MKNERKLPFECTIYDKTPQKITNPFSGKSCVIPPDAVAVYDVIMGMQMLGNPDWDIVRKGIDWFIDNEPNAYHILLD